VFTSIAPLTPEPVAQRQSASHLTASAVDTQHVINQLVDARLVATDRYGLLFHTDQGAELFKGLCGAIEEITCALYGDSPAADLAATHRTLLEIAKRGKPASGLESMTLGRSPQRAGNKPHRAPFATYCR
jgi:hypothetical protein